MVKTSVDSAAQVENHIASIGQNIKESNGNLKKSMETIANSLHALMEKTTRQASHQAEIDPNPVPTPEAQLKPEDQLQEEHEDRTEKDQEKEIQTISPTLIDPPAGGNQGYDKTIIDRLRRQQDQIDDLLVRFNKLENGENPVQVK